MAREKNANNVHWCDVICSGTRLKYITVTTILFVLALGIGFGIGYVTKKNKTTLYEPSEQDQTTYSNSSITTTVAPLPIRPCPPTLPEPWTSNVLLSLDETISLTNFTKYSIEYISPANGVTAMLMFKFDTVWGSWYVDDVSVKQKSDGDSGTTSILDNGSFETGNLGSKWSFCDPRYSWIIDGTVVSHTAHLGKYSYESQDPGVGSEEYLTQIFNIQGNTRYTIEFYLFYSGTPSSTTVTVLSH